VTSNVKAFNKLLLKQAKRTIEALGKDHHGAVTKYVYEKVILRTPVLTGHARHNWQVMVNKSDDVEREGVFGGVLTGEPITAMERAKLKDAMRVLQRQPFGQTVWIFNNVPYAQRLENGWSKKAPEGMAQITLIEVLEGVYKQQPKVIGDDGGE
jgi:hypothetical protein